MLKSVWFYLLVAAVVGAGGWYFYSHQEITVSSPITSAPAPSQSIVIQPKQSDEELNRQRQEGIGSIKNLKPVQIGPSLDKSNGK